VGKRKINNKINNLLKPNPHKYDWLKSYIKNHKIFNNIRLIIMDYLIKWVRLKYRYLRKNHGNDLILSPNFHYGPGRSAIRLCAKKAN